MLEGGRPWREPKQRKSTGGSGRGSGGGSGGAAGSGDGIETAAGSGDGIGDHNDVEMANSSPDVAKPKLDQSYARAVTKNLDKMHIKNARRV